MISKKELKFVTSNSTNVPYPGDMYAKETIDMLEDALEAFENRYQDKEYNLIFSNGEEISFAIQNKNLAHLLGINFKLLVSDEYQELIKKILGYTGQEHKNSFDMLKSIIKNRDNVLEHDSTSKSIRMLNYYKIMIKCLAFSRLTTFDEFNYGCIDFDKDTYERNTKISFTPRSNKLLFAPSNEAITPYFMMGIVFDTDFGKYVPETIIASERFGDFIKEQVLLLPIHVLIDDNEDLTKLSATNREKLQLLNMYKSIINEYKSDSFIDIYNDYENILKEGMSLVKKK